MYINPFLAGVLVAIFAEIAIIVAAVIVEYKKEKENEEDK